MTTSAEHHLHSGRRSFPKANVKILRYPRFSLQSLPSNQWQKDGCGGGQRAIRHNTILRTPYPISGPTLTTTGIMGLKHGIEKSTMWEHMLLKNDAESRFSVCSHMGVNFESFRTKRTLILQHIPSHGQPFIPEYTQ